MEGNMGRRTHRSVRRLLLAASFVLVLLEIPGAIELLRQPDPQIRLRHLTVMVAEPGGSGFDAGIRPGDELIAVDGVIVHSRADYKAALHRNDRGTSRWTVARGVDRIDIEVTLPPSVTRRDPALLFPTISGLCFLFLGFITYLRRDDALGKSFQICCLCFAASLGTPPGTGSVFLARLGAGLQDVAGLLLPLYLLRFVILFPEGTPHGELPQPILRRVLWPAFVLAPAHLLGALVPDNPVAIAIYDAVLLATALVFGLALASVLVVFLRKARGSRDWAYGSRMRLAAGGLVLGFGPLLLMTLGNQFAPDRVQGFGQLAILALPLVPASFSMALLRSGSIDLAYLLRQSLAAAVLVLGVAGLALFIVGLGKPLLPDHLRDGAYIVLLLLIPLAAITAHLPARWIDHVLYPEQARVRAIAGRSGLRLASERDPATVIEVFPEGLRKIAESDAAALYAPAKNGWARQRPRARVVAW
jgi:hypothetical protein